MSASTIVTSLSVLDQSRHALRLWSGVGRVAARADLTFTGETISTMRVRCGTTATLSDVVSVARAFDVRRSAILRFFQRERERRQRQRGKRQRMRP